MSACADWADLRVPAEPRSAVEGMPAATGCAG